MEHQPVFKKRKIIMRDYASFIWFLFTAAAIFFVLIVLLLGLGSGDTEGMGSTLATFLVVALITGFLCYRRLTFAKTVLEEGKRTDGIVTRPGSLLRSPKRVFYAYEVAGKQYKTRNAIMVMGFRSPLTQGQPVEIAYDASNPRKALLPVLYLPKK